MKFITQSEEHRSLGRKLIDCAKAIVAKIKATFSSQKARDAASQEAFGKDLAAVEKALKAWEEAYAEGQKAVKNAPVQESTGEGKKKSSIELIPINKESKNNAKLRGDAVLTTDKKILDVINFALTNRQSKGNYILVSTFYVTKNNKKTEGKIQFLAKQQDLATQEVSPSNQNVAQPTGKVKNSVAGTENIIFENLSKADQDKAYAEAVMMAATRMVDTKAKQWGAIVDDKGNPKVFYHGTSQGGFTKFDNLLTLMI